MVRSRILLFLAALGCACSSKAQQPAAQPPAAQPPATTQHDQPESAPASGDDVSLGHIAATVENPDDSFLKDGLGTPPEPEGPQVDDGDTAAKVEGSLDKEIIRRIVRAHINEIRTCYEKGLVKDPTLQGRVAIRFTVAADGSVSQSEIASNDAPLDEVGECIRERITTWRFPKPKGGGVVVVTYPFVLEPG